MLDEKEKQDIVEMFFGEIGLVKMLHDTWHQETPDNEFDHRSSTGNMRYFVREGLKKHEQTVGIFKLFLLYTDRRHRLQSKSF